MDTIKICIVEDDLEFQQWILEEISQNDQIRCVGRYDTGEGALSGIPKQQPDLVIMDLTLEKSTLSGIECMLRLKIVRSDIKFLVITANSNEQMVFEAMRVGAGAYIQKSDIPGKLNQLICEFHAGGAPMSPGIAQRVIASFHKPALDVLQLEQLSPMEKQVLALLSRGLMYKEIAREIKASEAMVKQHVHKIYRKLQVNNAIEAIRKYLANTNDIHPGLAL